MAKYGLNLKKSDYYDGYNPKINAGTRVAFQVGAFRFGHSMVSDVVERYNKFHVKLGNFRLEFGEFLEGIVPKSHLSYFHHFRIPTNVQPDSAAVHHVQAWHFGQSDTWIGEPGK